MTFLAYFFVTPFYLFWLIFCAVLAILGLFLPRFKSEIDLQDVKKQVTVCKVLNEKGLLSDENYSFETNQVASQYDQSTFRGYLFILGPIIYLLQRVSYFDSFLMSLVNKWMQVHKVSKSDLRAGAFFYWLANFCVSIAQSTGRVLSLFLN